MSSSGESTPNRPADFMRPHTLPSRPGGRESCRSFLLGETHPALVLCIRFWRLDSILPDLHLIVSNSMILDIDQGNPSGSQMNSLGTARRAQILKEPENQRLMKLMVERIALQRADQIAKGKNVTPDALIGLALTEAQDYLSKDRGREL